jgi:hypothetical protein
MGAVYVMRAAQSKGIADLLALWPAPLGYGSTGSKPPWLVQCKYSIHGGGNLSAKEAAGVVALAEETGGVPVLARPGKNGRGVEFINLKTKEQIG